MKAFGVQRCIDSMQIPIDGAQDERMGMKIFFGSLSGAGVACMLFCVLDAAVAQAPNISVNVKSPEIGVFYFPGWRDNVKGQDEQKPWQRIQKFPERKPLLGWYQDGEDAVMRQQIAWMKEYGIDYVIFSWYWDGNQPWLGHAVKSFEKVNDEKMKFAVMWANHGRAPQSGAFFYSMARYWIDNYFKRTDYLKIDGKPVAFIQMADSLDNKAKAFGSSAEELVAKVRLMAVNAGLPGVYFVAGGGGGSILKNDRGEPKGFDAYFAYNYHTGPMGRTRGEKRGSRSYAEMDEAYQQHWRWMMEHANAPYILPLTSGWDKRPWGGSADPNHDHSIASPEEFARHLKAARQVMQKYPRKTLGMATICCWNEFGEGSFIEPTEKQRFIYLEQVKKSFSK